MELYLHDYDESEKLEKFESCAAINYQRQCGGLMGVILSDHLLTSASAGLSRV